MKKRNSKGQTRRLSKGRSRITGSSSKARLRAHKFGVTASLVGMLIGMLLVYASQKTIHYV